VILDMVDADRLPCKLLSLRQPEPQRHKRNVRIVLLVLNHRFCSRRQHPARLPVPWMFQSLQVTCKGTVHPV
jgi:hypothetical protein